MTIETPAVFEHYLEGKLVVRFEEADFDLRLDTDEFAWCAAKDDIEKAFPYPVARWNRPLNAWLIDDSENNRAIIQAIRDKYFGGNNVFKQ